ncbi:RNB domain-containing ribonuclease [Arcanobacterium bovis]|uniref:RNB domain-containing ribonuclease n=1 Tax=Arcanobacterium bovis TaxID=2529275 RepID=A0A4Q9UZQ5_9ACTO|nr:RNB domain-containing ribonuclease [Arcanobacterium bovis]TBW21442.1 RNB domain-containing ribonuclease [Arcanobacterium bovis]
MPKIALQANEAAKAAVADAISQLKIEAGVTENFSPQALAQAERSCDIDISDLPDKRDIPLVTIDPEGSRDLDQAVYLEENDRGFVVYYAIAALNLFVEPESVLDLELRERGQTVYLPDASIPLHPRVVSEGAASLLPNVDRPAYVWTHKLNREGELERTDVVLAQVRSRAQLSYVQVQECVDGGVGLPNEVPSSLAPLLKTIGELRIAAEVARGGISLDLPEQRIESTDRGFKLVFRELTQVENWNAQISLLTGMAAAKLMVDANVGVLRTLPAAQDEDMARLRRVADALGLNWKREQTYPEFLRTLDSTSGTALVFLNQAAGLFRGAGYLSLPEVDGTTVDAQKRLHGAIAAEYAHVTAPLRRLVDRYGLEVCRCICAHEPIPEWVLHILPQLPKIMNESNRKVNALEKRALGAVEALILQGREGEKFAATVIELREQREDEPGIVRGKIMLDDPALEASVSGASLPLGERIEVELERVDITKGKSYFRYQSSAEKE